MAVIDISGRHFASRLLASKTEDDVYHRYNEIEIHEYYDIDNTDARASRGNRNQKK